MTPILAFRPSRVLVMNPEKQKAAGVICKRSDGPKPFVLVLKSEIRFAFASVSLTTIKASKGRRRLPQNKR